MFTSVLVAQRLPQTPVPVLTLYGYPGSTVQVQYVDVLGSTNQWTPLTNVILGVGSFTFSDPSLPPSGQRFYRALTLAGTPLTVSSNWVWIPPGRFLMGSPTTEEGRVNTEGPQTWVTLTRGFYICKHLVTQGEYLSVMGYNPSYFSGVTNRPVEAASWFGATNYCGTLTQQEQAAERLPANWRYRLPTEAEWEYACRAGTTTRFSYGDDPGYVQLPAYGWYDDNSYSLTPPAVGVSWFVLGRYYSTQPVGQKLPNPWGLYDMHGELSEWCQDWFGFYPGGSVVDPQGPAIGTERIVRSGSWYDDPYSLRSAYRYATEPDNVSGLFGFHAVLAPVGP
jgi:formylglycine-generating enzyme required for sulfatase activity